MKTWTLSGVWESAAREKKLRYLNSFHVHRSSLRVDLSGIKKPLVFKKR